MRAVFSLNHHRHHHHHRRGRRRRRRPTASLRRRRASAKKTIQEEDKEDEDKEEDEDEVTPRSLKVYLATRPLDGFERVHEILGGGKLYPKQLLHHATVVEMTTERSASLHYLVDFAPKNALAVDTAFKLVVLRTSVRGVIRHEIVEKTFTNRYALSGIEQIGEVKRKSILEAAFDAANASAADAEASKTRGAYEAIDRVSEEEFYAFYDWQNLKLCENDCRDFARAYLEYLLDDSR